MKLNLRPQTCPQRRAEASGLAISAPVYVCHWLRLQLRRLCLTRGSRCTIAVLFYFIYLCFCGNSGCCVGERLSDGEAVGAPCALDTKGMVSPHPAPPHWHTVILFFSKCGLGMSEEEMELWFFKGRGTEASPRSLASPPDQPVTLCWTRLAPRTWLSPWTWLTPRTWLSPRTQRTPWTQLAPRTRFSPLARLLGNQPSMKPVVRVTRTHW